ncbi:MAG: class F sortase, partial [Actinomycetia bacterium]|nr:class F sortase [Actinomycetes bacterium]
GAPGVTVVFASVVWATDGDTDRPPQFGEASPGNGAADAAEPGGRQDRPSPSSDGSAPAQIPGTEPESATPTRLTINALDVDATVVPSGVTQAGNAQIPPDGDVVGWYRFGSAPGDPNGSAVMIGHRDTEAEGPGALFDLDALERGDVITVRSGQLFYRYRVVALRSIDKDGLPDAIFRRGGPHQLVVITCGGAFISEAGGYQDNLIAVAVPEDR